jgi:hypothetical protein
MHQVVLCDPWRRTIVWAGTFCPAPIVTTKYVCMNYLGMSLKNIPLRGGDSMLNAPEKILVTMKGEIE